MRGLMDRVAPLACVAAAFFVMHSTAAAQREEFIVQTSAETVSELVRDTYRGVPRDVLKAAQGVVIIPNMLQAGFVFGARIGRGIVLVRDTATGEWSNPFFIRMTGGSFGLQAGANANSMMLVFRDRRTIDRFLMGMNKLTFGVDASFALGPTGSGIGANTDPSLQADILVYSRSRGLYAGAAIGGAVARVDFRSNWTFYGMDATPKEIIENVEGLVVPESVAQLKQELTVPEADAGESEPGRKRPARPIDESPIIEPIPGFDPDRDS